MDPPSGGAAGCASPPREVLPCPVLVPPRTFGAGGGTGQVPAQPCPHAWLPPNLAALWPPAPPSLVPERAAGSFPDSPFGAAPWPRAAARLPPGRERGCGFAPLWFWALGLRGGGDSRCWDEGTVTSTARAPLCLVRRGQASGQRLPGPCWEPGWTRQIWEGIGVGSASTP